MVLQEAVNRGKYAVGGLLLVQNEIKMLKRASAGPLSPFNFSFSADIRILTLRNQYVCQWFRANYNCRPLVKCRSAPLNWAPCEDQRLVKTLNQPLSIHRRQT